MGRQRGRKQQRSSRPIARPRGATPARDRLRSSAAIGWRDVCFCGCLAVVLAGGLYWLFGDIGLNLADEGFLLDGVARTAAGDVPLRDFQSYDPGRYYWGAAGSLLFGSGILAGRVSAAVFQAVGLFCGLLVARRAVGQAWLLLPIGVILALWMFPTYRQFDCSLPMISIYGAVCLIERPSSRRHFLCGMLVGILSFFGRNHGLYAGLGILVLICFLEYRLREGDFLRKLALYGAGVAAGFAPLLIMLAAVPGFASSYVESWLPLLRGTQVFLPLPVPWPWTVDYSRLGWYQALGKGAYGVSFVLVPLVYVLGLIVAWFTKRDELRQRSVLIAASAIGVFYVQHTFGRADAEHLAASISPMLLGFIGIPAAFGAGRRLLPALVASSTLCLITLLAVSRVNGTFAHLRPGTSAPRLIQFQVRGDVLRLREWEAVYLARVGRVVERHVPANAPLFIAPNRTTLYPVLGRTSPTWWLYFLWRADEEAQLSVIRSLRERGVDWALVREGASDAAGPQDLRFRYTNPLVWDHLSKHFEAIHDPELPRNHLLLRRSVRTAR